MWFGKRTVVVTLYFDKGFGWQNDVLSLQCRTCKWKATKKVEMTLLEGVCLCDHYYSILRKTEMVKGVNSVCLPVLCLMSFVFVDMWSQHENYMQNMPSQYCHLPPSIAGVRNEWSCTFPSLYTFMAFMGTTLTSLSCRHNAVSCRLCRYCV